MDRVRLYLPLIFTSLVAGWMVLKPIIAEGSFDATDIAQVIAAVATAATVYLARNVALPGSAKLKTVMTGVGTLAGFCAVAFIGGLDSDEFLDLIVLVAGFAGVSLAAQPQPVEVVVPQPAVDADGDPNPPAVS